MLRSSRVAKRVEELVVWRLGNELREKVHAITADPPVSKDFRFCSQTRDAASSIARNISEGFGRFRPADFARFMEIAVASLMETKDSLKDGLDRGYFTPARVGPAQQLAERSIKCSVKFIVYLKSAAEKRRRRRTKNDEPRT